MNEKLALVFHSQVKGLITIGDSKPDIEFAPAIKVCAFPYTSQNSEKANHIKCCLVNLFGLDV
jgi:hypothetical protein